MTGTSSSSFPVCDATCALALAPRDLALLAQGFACLFWGSFALVGVGIDAFVSGTPRVFIVILGLLGGLGTGLAGQRLRRVGQSHPAWRRATGWLWVTGWLTAYLTPLAWIWLLLPANTYLLGNALAWGGVFIAHLVAANYCVHVLGRLLPSKLLAAQGVLYGLAVVLMLLVPFLMLAMGLLQTAWGGFNALSQLRYWLAELKLPAVAFFVWLAPLSLTLSLVWTAQDMVWERLTRPPADNTLTPAS